MSEELATRDPNSEIPKKFMDILLKTVKNARNPKYSDVQDGVIAAGAVMELTETLEKILARSER